MIRKLFLMLLAAAICSSSLMARESSDPFEARAWLQMNYDIADVYWVAPYAESTGTDIPVDYGSILWEWLNPPIAPPNGYSGPPSIPNEIQVKSAEGGVKFNYLIVVNQLPQDGVEPGNFTYVYKDNPVNFFVCYEDVDGEIHLEWTSAIVEIVYISPY